MENPFLQVNNANKILKWSLTFVLALAVFTAIFASNKVDEASHKVRELYIYKKIFIKEDQGKIDELQKQLNKSNSELKKLTLTKEVIKNHILAMNEKLSPRVADRYAQTIMRESSKRGHSALVQTALLSSESSFRSDPHHALGGVVGMGGIYWNVWKDQLRKEGIAYSKEDLKNPYVNIKASAYIVSCYMGECHDIPREALTHYKGYSKLGRSQADGVMKVALDLKRKVRNGGNC